MLFKTESVGSASAHGSIIGKNFPSTFLFEPSVGFKIFAKHLIKVLLPDPFAQIIPNLYPFTNLKFIF